MLSKCLTNLQSLVMIDTMNRFKFLLGATLVSAFCIQETIAQVWCSKLKVIFDAMS